MQAILTVMNVNLTSERIVFVESFRDSRPLRRP